jgi:hypothetical protein
MVEEEVVDDDHQFAKNDRAKASCHPHQHHQKVYESPLVIL